MTEKQKQIFVTIFGVAGAVYLFHFFHWMLQERDTRYIERIIASAGATLQKDPPGIERVEKFVQTLKAIDPGYTSIEMKQALAGYVAALEDGISALRMGKDTASVDRVIAQRKEALLDAERKHRWFGGGN